MEPKQPSPRIQPPRPRVEPPSEPDEPPPPPLFHDLDDSADEQVRERAAPRTWKTITDPPRV